MLASSTVIRTAAGALVFLCVAAAVSAAAQNADGRDVYHRACAACHGVDGRGMPRDLVGFDVPLPDFTDCAFSTVEPTADWLAVVHDGGPVRAFDRRMPAFGDALSEDQIVAVLEFIRGFCRDDAWPRGELNLPRPLVTEKAFPENEVVVTTAVSSGETTSELVYERRLGARGQVEIAVPVAFQTGEGGWRRGLGDIAVALKHVLFDDHRAGRIVSVGGEVILPTGKQSEGLGAGYTIVEPSVAYGQLLTPHAFVHTQAGAELPTSGEAAGEAFWRVAIGTTVEQKRFGRAWSPMIELLAARSLGAAARTEWDLVPQLQVTLSRRQHVRLNAGVGVPMTERPERGVRLVTYFLWDWFDGGLFEGWR
jgi:hypothetical protein